MSKILKNNTAGVIQIADMGVDLPLGNYTIPPTQYTDWSGSVDILTRISSGDITVNDGLIDLSVADGLNFIKYPDTAFNIRFLSPTDRSNGFTKKNVQEAIEEARDSAPGTNSRFVVVCAFPGSAKNVYLQFFRDTPSSAAGFVMAENGILKAISLSIQDYNTPPGTFTFSIRKNGAVITTLDITYPTRKTYVSGLSLSLSAGDEISVNGANTSPDVNYPIMGLFIKT